MVIGQTMFSVRHGTEHRVERALQELAALLREADGHIGHRVLRSFGMSPLGSALCGEGREAGLGEIHFVFETEWTSLEAHDAFYQGAQVRRIYGTLQSILTGGPFEVLYDALVEEPQRDGAAV
ncbi:MAG TPA: antibiotic biosynthesis monooxygenase [Thermoleophilia bacterium]|mgnify:FL=1|jgi:heme-degrading monooxygenase HmoA|nr:antibiotic biosynthesis monooxygenase [Acidobacteriota bacterium]OPZ46223.1 MAG: Antibiotic biosynthesis monooxygenase [Actinobacteria bacterium ADurb.BinA094]HQF52167.1 antibiotic biosynthesis monooxygenase [Thermoleophilia bacterium]HQH21915.1 antibiotic biosynthesis monooxygenase [Thermoleophilia bacterium]